MRPAARRPARLSAAGALLACACVLSPGAAAGGEGASGARVSLRSVSWVTARETGDSLLAASETLTGPEREAVTELRWELSLDAGALRLGARPRLALAAREWAQRHEADARESEARLFVNEAHAAWQARPDLLLSAERTVADWGPAVVFSASNPLGRRDARLNPREEQPGRDFIAVRWLPAGPVSGSLLANVGAGRTAGEDFRRTLVLKLDRTVEHGSQTVVVSGAEEEPPRLGANATRTIGDAALLYADASGASRDIEAVVGASHTFAAGPTIAAEYFFNESGSPRGAPAALALHAAADRREIFLRRNYLLLQWSDADLTRARSVVLRALRCLDDGSTALVASFEQGVGGHLRLFAFGMRTFGGRDDELTAVLRTVVTAGLEYAF